MHDRAAGVAVKKMLAVRAGAPQHPTVDDRRAVDEAALGARHPYRLATEPSLMQPGQPVQRVTFGHV